MAGRSKKIAATTRYASHASREGDGLFDEFATCGQAHDRVNVTRDVYASQSSQLLGRAQSDFKLGRHGLGVLDKGRVFRFRPVRLLNLEKFS